MNDYKDSLYPLAAKDFFLAMGMNVKVHFVDVMNDMPMYSKDSPVGSVSKWYHGEFVVERMPDSADGARVLKFHRPN